MTTYKIAIQSGPDGKPLDKTYLEKNLPMYVQHDIDALIIGEKNKVLHLDCLHNELYGSINSALWDDEITQEQASYLREKYLGLTNER